MSLVSQGTEETSILLDGQFDHPLAAALKTAYEKTRAGESKLPRWICGMRGMSGLKYRYLINNLIAELPDARYLEVGSWAGSTACSAIYGNRLTVTCIDNWSQFGGPKEDFLANVRRCLSDQVRFRFREQSYQDVDFTSLGFFNLYLFDGPHEEADHLQGLMRAQPCLDDVYLLIVDDWNWSSVRKGTKHALQKLGAEILACLIIRTTQDDSHPTLDRQRSDWHNGYFIAVCRKTSAA
ncbi:class I SAM-dependent methyltransferase [Rhodovibrionaceae bacterium A322]